MTDKAKDKIKKATDIIYLYGGIDGGHHKQWVLDQVVRILLGDKYTDWVTEYSKDDLGDFVYEWDEGIAP